MFLNREPKGAEWSVSVAPRTVDFFSSELRYHVCARRPPTSIYMSFVYPTPVWLFSWFDFRDMIVKL